MKYKLINIQLEPVRNDPQRESCRRGKEFAYDHASRDKLVPITKGTDTRIKIKVNAQRRSMKGILLLFIEPYTGRTRDSQKYIFPDLKKVSITINGLPTCFATKASKVRTSGARSAAFS